ncbi:MAG: bifunctional helix-turn-helix transcriptional regulator/GNAT family N-acetyltransferase [Phenylobacterium sp.]|uniref:bifunctional helix-turn-helix transcriptional regulator/GNAT family N-acetyltransferase n=1 Tax=Phenylobacterium sp. TaxID=1871053 RepID=UPI001A39D9CC|nr:bifunctional helix-turn-helix transcriptional regulator/GNAT family N-acetyltransferase [Phenylobacterium sp.]MBL8556908.1 bifunctional helix-turn-helix transcriptional regulator/GNAT family N-acetyltransferase [Phenylobacterium sp.]
MTEIDTVAAVRRFSRFYTRAIGVLERGYLGSPYTLAENRVIWEIAHAEGITPGAISAALRLDAGYLSRMLARLERDGLVARSRSERDGRSVTLSLTETGRTTFATLDGRSAALVEDLLGRLSGPQRAAFAGALATAQDLLEPPAERPPERPAVTLRPHRIGDMGWVTEQHGLLYGREYGWGFGIEAVTAKICSDFLERFDPARERCWIAERGGTRIGCVFLVREDETTARLRLLLLDPAARGERLGRRLVEECVAFAREAGYREIVLWTHKVLTAARAIYASVGFQIAETWEHDEFGKTEVSETWRMTL